LFSLQPQSGIQLRSKLARDAHLDSDELPSNLHVLKQTVQVQGIHALIRYDLGYMCAYTHTFVDINIYAPSVLNTKIIIRRCWS